MSREDSEMKGSIENGLAKICKKYGWNEVYVEEYTMQAAVKASVFFQALGFDYGDRIPSVYKLNDTILESLIYLAEGTSLDDKSMGWTGTGMFRISRFWDEDSEQWEFNIALELADIYEHRIKE